MRVAMDSNVLVYAEGYGDAKRCKQAREVVAALNSAEVLIPAQVLGELYNVLTRKALRTPELARDAMMSWSDAFDVGDSNLPAMLAAADLAATHSLQFWDALILSVAAAHRCRVLLSEDMSDGFVWQGVTVVNPFATKKHALMAQLFA
jgi:predicted nucleic acid-binding protein